MLQLCLYLHELQFHRCNHLLYNHFSLNFLIQYRYLYVSQRVCQIKSVLDWNLWVCPYPPLKKEPDSAQLCSFCKYLNSDFVNACRGTCELWRSWRGQCNKGIPHRRAKQMFTLCIFFTCLDDKEQHIHSLYPSSQKVLKKGDAFTPILI